MKLNKALALLFKIGQDEATDNGKYPPILVGLTAKKTWDDATKSFTDEVKLILATAYFHALRHEKLEVELPSDILTIKEVKNLNERIESGEEIQLDFDELRIGLKVGFKGETTVFATALGMTTEVM